MKRVLFASIVLVACSSTQPPPAAPAKEESAADKCLAIAGAKHERRPDEPAKITVKHLLVKYTGAKGSVPTPRTREAACLRALEAREKMEKQGMSFADAVATYSEEAGAASREGSIGSVTRKDVVPAFADAAFELGRGEVSHVVETEFGFHVIQRSE